jgi:hypothetical protein
MLRSQAELHKESAFAKAILSNDVVHIQVSYGNGEGFQKEKESQFPQTALSLRLLHSYFAGRDMTFAKFKIKLTGFLGRDPYRKNLQISTALEIIRDDWRRRFPAPKEAHVIFVVGIDEVQDLLDDSATDKNLRLQSLSTTFKAIGTAICSVASGGIFLVPLLAGTTQRDFKEIISGSSYVGANLSPRVLDWGSVVSIVKASRWWDGVVTDVDSRLSLVRCLMDLGGLPRAIEKFIEGVEDYVGSSHVPWKRLRDKVQAVLEERYVALNRESYQEDLLRLVLGGRTVSEQDSCGNVTLDTLRKLGVISIEDGQIAMPLIYLV